MTWAKGYVSLILSTRHDPKPEPVPPVRLWITIVPCGENNRYMYLGRCYWVQCGSAVALRLVRLPPHRVVRIQAMTGECFYVIAKDTSLSQCPSPTWCINGYPQTWCWETPYNGQELQPGESTILLVASCNRNRNKLQPDGSLGSYEDFTYLQKAHNDTWKNLFEKE